MEELPTLALVRAMGDRLVPTQERLLLTPAFVTVGSAHAAWTATA
jgi:hypothetical protein